MGKPGASMGFRLTRKQGILAGIIPLLSVGLAGLIYALCPPSSGQPAGAIAKNAHRYSVAETHPNELRCVALAVVLCVFGLLLLRSAQWARSRPTTDGPPCRLQVKQCLYLLSVTAIGVAVFNFGWDAATYINDQTTQWGLLSISAYYVLLAVAIGSFMLELLLQRLSKRPFVQCICYVGVVFFGFVGFFILASFPSLEFIYPFFFNVILSVLLTLVGAAPLILSMASEPRGTP
jgi:hypothetical protein